MSNDNHTTNNDKYIHILPDNAVHISEYGGSMISLYYLPDTNKFYKEIAGTLYKKIMQIPQDTKIYSRISPQGKNPCINVTSNDKKHLHIPLSKLMKVINENDLKNNNTFNK